MLRRLIGEYALYRNLPLDLFYVLLYAARGIFIIDNDNDL